MLFEELFNIDSEVVVDPISTTGMIRHVFFDIVDNILKNYNLVVLGVCFIISHNLCVIGKLLLGHFGGL